VLSWPEFARAEPDLARDGAALLYQFGVGLAFLGTVRPDGGPRLHPMCPLISDEGLFAFLIPSPKQRDLGRDARYALHSFPTEDTEDAFYLTGVAEPVADGRLRDALAEQFVAERTRFSVPPPATDHRLFGFRLGSALLTRTAGHGDHHPRHTVWRG
jgi:hypothetical protein